MVASSFASGKLAFAWGMLPAGWVFARGVVAACVIYHVRALLFSPCMRKADPRGDDIPPYLIFRTIRSAASALQLNRSGEVDGPETKLFEKVRTHLRESNFLRETRMICIARGRTSRLNGLPRVMHVTCCPPRKPDLLEGVFVIFLIRVRRRHRRPRPSVWAAVPKQSGRCALSHSVARVVINPLVIVLRLCNRHLNRMRGSGVWPGA